jgi:hypothetical protein
MTPGGQYWTRKGVAIGRDLTNQRENAPPRRRAEKFSPVCAGVAIGGAASGAVFEPPTRVAGLHDIARAATRARNPMPTGAAIRRRVDWPAWSLAARRASSRASRNNPFR